MRHTPPLRKKNLPLAEKNFAARFYAISIRDRSLK